MDKKGFIREGGYQPKFITNPIREFRDGYQPSQQPTQQQTGGNSNTSRPSPPSGGSGVPDKSD